MEDYRVLVVDDEDDFRETFVKRLEKRNLSVTEAESGEKAMEILDEKLFDVVILDVKMPGMDGIETLREMKRKRPLMEVIMLTGHATVESGVEGMKLGAFDYLLKPADFKDLSAKLEAARKRKDEQEERIRKAEARFLLRKVGEI